MMRYIFVFIFFIQLLSAGVNNCDNRLFSLSAYDKGSKSLKISSVLKELSFKCNVSILFKDKESKEKIKKHLDYINIKNYTFESFLDFLFNEANLFYTYNKEKHLINVQYKKTQTFNVDYINVSELTSQSSKSISSGSGGGGSTGGSTGGGSSSSNDQMTMTTKSEFTFWENLKKSLLKLFPDTQKVSISMNRGASLLTISADKKDMKKAQKFLNLLMERMHKQVLVEVKLIELVYDDSHSTGIDWSKLDVSLNVGLNKIEGTAGNTFKNSYKIVYNFSTSDFFKYLDKFGDVKVMSNPKILTMNNQPAVVNVGQQLSYKYQTGSVGTTGGTAASTTTFSLGSTFIGITLYVIPEITNNNEIIMSINPVVSSLVEDNLPKTQIREIPPDTKIKQMTSIVKVKDGQKVLIGGLISATKGEDTTKVPVLGDIPILGSVFSYRNNKKTRTEMFILITPKIVKSSSMPTIDDVDNDKFFSTSKLKPVAKGMNKLKVK